MKNKKTARVRRRVSCLTAAAVILGLLAVVCGWFGFVSPPVAPPPEPVATEATLETSLATESTEISSEPPEETGEWTEAESCLETEGSTSPAPEETEEWAEAETVPETDEPTSPAPEEEEIPEPDAFSTKMRLACGICTLAEVIVLLLLLTLRRNIRAHREKEKGPMEPIPTTWKRMPQALAPAPGITLGRLHDIGRRDYQQDSFGHIPVLEGSGVLAVLADGMGGLTGGERVSRKIIMEALNFGAALTSDGLPNALPEMVDGVNTAVNRMLGPQGLYSSGSTVVAALLAQEKLWWISVGDSRVYLYRAGQINQLSRDHDLLQEWMGDILEGKRSLEEARADPDSRKLTSFIGMGELRYVDGCHTPIPLLPGDRVLLMSDGVYGTLSDHEMEAILADSPDVQDAADRFGQRIRQAALPYQDNYTLIILGYAG